MVVYNLKQNIIKTKTRRYRANLIVAFSLFFIVSFMMLFSIENTGLQNITNSMVYVYNPISSLYSDSGNIIFTSGELFNKDSVDLTLPVVSSDIEIDNMGAIHIGITNSIMVKAPDAGVVEKVGVTLDGIKYIKINHSQTISTIIENVDIIAVGSGVIVKKGQDIATAREGERVVLKVLHNGFQISNIKLKQSKVVWEN